MLQILGFEERAGDLADAVVGELHAALEEVPEHLLGGRVRERGAPMNDARTDTEEHRRLARADAGDEPWRQWGPYLAE